MWGRYQYRQRAVVTVHCGSLGRVGEGLTAVFGMGTGEVGCQFIILLHRIQVQSAQGLGHYPVGPQRMGQGGWRTELVGKQVEGQ